MHSTLLFTSKSAYCSGRITRTAPNRLVFLLRLLISAILLMKWLLCSVDEEGGSLSNAISPQVGEPLQISTNISTHSVSLTQELIQVIKSKVSSGMYNNSSEVIREAIRRFDEYDELLYGLKLDKLKTEIAIGIEQADRGEYSNRTVEDIIADAKSRKKRKKR